MRKLVEPWSKAFKTTVGDRDLIYCWGRLVVQKNSYLKFEFWQQVNSLEDNTRKAPRRVFLELVTGLKFQTRSMKIWNEGTLTEIVVKNGRYLISSSKKTLAEGSLEGADIVLPSNFPAMLAYKILIETKFSPRAVFQFKCFSPELLVAFDYNIKQSGYSKWTSSLDEEIEIDRDGQLLSIIAPSGARVLAFRARQPRWRRGGSRRVTRSTGNRVALSDFHKRAIEETEILIDDFEIDFNGWVVRATLMQPKGNCALIAQCLILGGSGIHDRDGRSAEMNIGYGEWARRLARRGVTSIRFDKPGYGEGYKNSSGDSPTYNDYVEFAVRASIRLKSQINRGDVPLVLIGHSLGGVCAMEIAPRVHANGVILLAVPGRPLEDLLVEQITQQHMRLGARDEDIQSVLRDTRELFRYAKNCDTWIEDQIPQRIYLMRDMARWLKDVMVRHPLELISSLTCPILILQGDCDMQISVKDAELLQSAASANSQNTTLIIQQHHDHMFRIVAHSGDLRPYFDKRRRISGTTTQAILKWLNSTFSTSLANNDEPSRYVKPRRRSLMKI
jgi:uncharacterized protein